MQLVENFRRIWRGLVGGTGEPAGPVAESAKPAPTSSAEEAVRPSPEGPAPEPEGEAACDEEELLDDLTVIRGIGPARQERLYAAGIRSYSQLAAVAPEDVRSALSSENQQVKVEEWIRQAGELVQKE